MTAAGNTQLFFELSVDMHCIASPDAKMLHVNSRWEKVLGYTVAELKAGSFLDLVHPDDVTQTLGAMEQLNSGQTVANFSNRYRRKDGKYLDLDWSAILNQEDGLYYA